MLSKEIFPDLKLGLLHGRMKPDEKDEAMLKFRDGKYDILVSTTVVEVGVDVPNATVMLIEGADRFGLAQLHQLRGRVGRGMEQSYCLLIPTHEDDAENERLQAMAESNDGFVLAERDLQQRGPGEFLGTRQSGYGLGPAHGKLHRRAPHREGPHGGRKAVRGGSRPDKAGGRLACRNAGEILESRKRR